MITKGLQSINLVENSSGICGVMLLLLGCGPWGILPFRFGFRMRVTVARYAVLFFFPDPKLGCQLAVAPFWLGAAAMVLIFSFLGFLDSRLPLAMPLSPCRFKLTIGL